MCQKAEGESNYLVARDKDIRLRGWEAFHAGKPKSANPESTHPLPEYCDRRQWDFGWDTAQKGEKAW